MNSFIPTLPTRLTPIDVPRASAASPFHTNAIITLQLPQSGSQDKMCMTPVVQKPVWPETVVSAGQEHKTTGRDGNSKIVKIMYCFFCILILISQDIYVNKINPKFH